MKRLSMCRPTTVPPPLSFHQPCRPFRGAVPWDTQINRKDPPYEPIVLLTEEFGRARRDLFAPAHYTTAHCDGLADLLEAAQEIIQQCIILLDYIQTTLDWWYAIFLHSLHRTLRESTVLVQCVRGQIELGRLHADRSDTYAQLKEMIAKIESRCQKLQWLPFHDAVLPEETKVRAQAS